MPRARRDVEQEGCADYAPVARAVLEAVPALLREAEAAGAVALARILGQALSEAERVVKRVEPPECHPILAAPMVAERENEVVRNVAPPRPGG